MLPFPGYKSRRIIEKENPVIKHGSWSNTIRKAKIKHVKRSILKGRLRYFYRCKDIPKIVSAAKEDRRRH